MHIELYQALTRANVTESDAERVVHEIEVHMASLVTEAVKSISADIQIVGAKLEAEAKSTRTVLEAQGKSIDRNFDITKWMIIGVATFISLAIAVVGFADKLR